MDHDNGALILHIGELGCVVILGLATEKLLTDGKALLSQLKDAGLVVSAFEQVEVYLGTHAFEPFVDVVLCDGVSTRGNICVAAGFCLHDA